MKIDTLRSRLSNAEEKLNKKLVTIEKKKGSVAKKQGALSKRTDVGSDEYIMFQWGIQSLVEDIARIEKEVVQIRGTIEGYRKQLSGEMEKQDFMIHKVPDVCKKLQIELVTRWDAWDIKRRDKMREAYRSMSYDEFRREYSRADMQFRFKSDDEIHSANVKSAEMLIVDLLNRVSQITGEVRDWSGVRLTGGTGGMPVLNGVVKGNEGIAVVESVLAGGYNIQRLHIRVLVHSV